MSLDADVSVVITCFNYGRYVDQAIRSVLNQTVSPREIIVIDDGSTDDSRDVIRQFGDRVVLHAKSNTGVVDTKNLGLVLAAGEWIIFLDADDRLHAGYVQRTLTAALETGAALVYTDMTFFGAEHGRIRSRPFNPLLLARGNYIHNSALMKRRVVAQVGGYKPAMAAGFEDWELYLTLSEHRVRATWVGESLLSYRRHEDAGRDARARQQQHDIVQLIKSLHPRLYTRRRRLLGFFLATKDYPRRRLRSRTEVQRK